MKTRIVLTGILRDNDLFLVVKRNENDDLYPGAWEFPGGHLEDGETLKDGLKRELMEEIGYTEDFNPIITHYFDEVKEKNNELKRVIQITRANSLKLQNTGMIPILGNIKTTKSLNKFCNNLNEINNSLKSQY